MKIFDKLPQLKRIEHEGSVKKLHPDFRTTKDNFWYFNRLHSDLKTNPTLKVVFKFDDPALLDNCPFMAKIGINESDGPKYFGVAFGTNINRAELEHWAEKFVWAHLITDLDENGVKKDGASEIDLRPDVKKS
ncbi:MAG: hypothetical protein M1320_01610 [Patescibacteria group bacterium]|nr:hypothetical protein [Patescibacteria group bacterium]